MTTVVDCKGMGIDEVELNSVVLLCGVTTFYKRHASVAGAKPVTVSRSLRPNSTPYTIGP